MRILRFFNQNSRKKLLPIVFFVAILIFVLYGVQDATDNSGRLQYDLTVRAIQRAITDCYAIEGYYPPNMQYLYDNYPVRVDTERYFVLYNVFAPNIRPTVQLIDRRSPIYE